MAINADRRQGARCRAGSCRISSPVALPRPDALFLDEGTAIREDENRIADMIALLPIPLHVISHRRLDRAADIFYRLRAAAGGC